MPKPKTPPTRIAIIGTGGMAIAHARNYKKIRGCNLCAAVDVDEAKATQFAKEHSIAATFKSVEALIASQSVDAVSIVTPDAYHAALSIQCLKAGLHVLCEKPLALNHADAKRMVKAAKDSGKINMVNFSYRDWSCIQKVATLVQSGKLGDIRHVEASYHQSWLVSNEWGEWRTSPNWLWRLSKAHGSKGVLGDVGVHIFDFATFPAGPIKKIYAQLKAFPKAPRNRIGPYKLDANDSAVINVEFANGALGSIQTTRWMGGHLNRLFLKIAGTLGSVEIDSEVSTESYRICTGDDAMNTNTWKTISTQPTPSIYQRFIKSIRTNQQDQPDFTRGAEIQKLLDASYQSNELSKPVTIRP